MRDSWTLCRVKNGLGVEDGGVGASTLRENSIVASGDVPRRGRVLAHFLKIRFELVINVDNKSGRYRGGQTGLFPR